MPLFSFAAEKHYDIGNIIGHQNYAAIRELYRTAHNYYHTPNSNHEYLSAAAVYFDIIQEFHKFLQEVTDIDARRYVLTKEIIPAMANVENSLFAYLRFNDLADDTDLKAARKCLEMRTTMTRFHIWLGNQKAYEADCNQLSIINAFLTQKYGFAQAAVLITDVIGQIIRKSAIQDEALIPLLKLALTNLDTESITTTLDANLQAIYSRAQDEARAITQRLQEKESWWCCKRFLRAVNFTY